MSRKPTMKRPNKRPLWRWLLFPPRDQGLLFWLRGYYARIPVYLAVIIVVGLAITLFSGTVFRLESGAGLHDGMPGDDGDGGGGVEVPELVPPEGGIWNFIWDLRGSELQDASGALPIPVIGDLFGAITSFLGINIFDSVWAGPVNANPGQGTLFWITGLEFICVDFFILIPYVTQTNFASTMSTGQSIGFFVFKVAWDFIPVLIFGGIFAAILIMIIIAVAGPTIASAVGLGTVTIGSIIFSMAGMVIKELFEFIIKVPRRAILLLFSIIGLTISGLGLLIGILKIIPAVILGTISIITLLGSMFELTKRIIIFGISIVTFIMGLILLGAQSVVGILFVGIGIIFAGLEIITSPFAGFSRGIVNPKHSPNSRQYRHAAYKRIQQKIRGRRL